MKLARDFWTNKTTLTCAAAILTAIAGRLTGDITTPQMLAAIFAALIAAFKRDADVKGADRIVEAVKRS